MEHRASRESNRDALALAALVVLALGVRLALALLADRAIRWDEPDYLTLARNLVNGGGFQVAGRAELHYAPLFPAVAGLFYLVIGNLQWASNAVYILAGGALVIPVVLLARRLFGNRAALVSGLLIALVPALAAWPLYWGTMTEPLYLLLVFCGAYLTWRAAAGGGVWYAVGAGVLLSAAYLTRPEGLVYVALAGALLLAAILVRRRRAWGLLAFVGAAVMVMLPYQIYLRHETGQWMISGKLGVTYDIGRAVLADDPAEYDRVTASLDSTGKRILWYSPERFERDVTAEVLADPKTAINRVWENLKRLAGAWFDTSIFPKWLMLPVGLALLAAPWTRRSAAREVFWAVWLLPLAAFLPFHVEIRFFAPAVPVALVWVGRGLVGLGDWLCGTVRAAARRMPARGWRLVLTALPTLMVAAFLAVELPRVVAEGERSTDFSHREAGLWLREQTPSGSRVLARDLAVALYAEREWIPSPHADWEPFLAYARANTADYVVVDTREVTVLRPILVALGDPATAPAELQLEATLAGRSGVTLVYRLVPEGVP